jgi:hypothetical protein
MENADHELELELVSRPIRSIGSGVKLTPRYTHFHEKLLQWALGETVALHRVIKGTP